VPSDRDVYETTQEQLEVFGNFSRTFMVQIYLKDKNPEFVAKPKNKTISAAEFSQKPPKAAEKSYEQGLKKVKEGKTAEAIAHFQEALKVFPDYLLALNRLGEQYLISQKPAEAQPFFERALAVNPKFALAHINLGIILYEQKRFPEAIEHLEAANRADESYPMAHLHLGRALMDKNPPDFDRAERALLRAREIGGADLAYVRLHLFNLYLRRQAYDQAVGQLEDYLKDAPNGPHAASVREMLPKIKKQAAESVKKQ
jgi:tetratricopeptide (TPR) repeat protein